MEYKSKNLIQRIRSPETWEKANWFIGRKGLKEGLMVFKKEDLLPFSLAIFKVFLILFPLGYLYSILWSTNKISFYILIGITAPLGLGIFYFIDYLISKFVVVKE